MKLSYVSWEHCARSMNAIFGFCNWSVRTLALVPLYEPTQTKNKYDKLIWNVAYRAHVEVEVAGAVYQGWGYGEGKDANLGQAHESALKEAESDATKRAMRNLGDQFGLALYDKDQTHVEREPAPKPKPANPAAHFGLTRDQWEQVKTACGSKEKANESLNEAIEVGCTTAAEALDYILSGVTPAKSA